MLGSISSLPRRAVLSNSQTIQCNAQQIRHATLIRRPKRPYTFTQLVTLSDGSTYLHRTTSPVPVYKATKDVRNSPLWNPSSRKLLNVEDDEAGKLAGFRSRYGNAWDTGSAIDADGQATPKGEGESKLHDKSEDNLIDMIGSYHLNEAKTTVVARGISGKNSAKESERK
ncbi:uncharacterized protein PV09_05810 [Verruconis gallopava]|uniref:Ribosomal protein bL31m N-terminal domain-containing protein n=1 Tax=Verruconis gallopava TaxID=253628 RepID=A0A0D2A7K0_9PEZI|nr:uncharacterized protein PV09_05810 [Verruconis gallopava]KIW02738.1 hypothetical protein PV09_05810 [Verruconis gallopava]